MAEVIEVVAFGEDTKYLNGPQIIDSVKWAVKTHHGKPLIIIFPESVLGTEPISRIEGKKFVARINRVLQTHGNAFTFFSLIEKNRKRKFSISNTGYIITPSKAKPWFAYPKMAQWSKEFQKLTDIDDSIMERNAKKHRSQEALISFWIKRANKIKEFPQIHLAGKTIQLRVCADTFRTSLERHLPVNRSKKKPHVIIVPADGLARKNSDPSTQRMKISEGGHVLTVDAHYQRVLVHSKHQKPRGKRVSPFLSRQFGDFLNVSVHSPLKILRKRHR